MDALGQLEQTDLEKNEICDFSLVRTCTNRFYNETFQGHNKVIQYIL